MFFFFDFDISAFLFWVVGCFCCLDSASDAEQKLTAASDVLFWDQIIEADQFFLSTFGGRMLWISAHRIFFVFRCTHFERPITSIHANSMVRAGALRAFVLNNNNLCIADLVIV